MITTIKIYQNAREYQRDSVIMAAAGWHIVDTAGFQPRRTIPGLVLVPFALFRPPKGQLVITYGREQPVGKSTQPLVPTFAEQRQAFKDNIARHNAAIEQQMLDAKAADPNSRAGENIGPKWLKIRRLR